MRPILINLIVGTSCLLVGFGVGAWQGPKLKDSQAGTWVASAIAKVKGSKDGEESQIESNEYPVIKWRPKPLTDGPDAIVRLWTTFEPGAAPDQPGTMKYKLTLFKATKRDSREIQLLDRLGFKLMQFNAADFHDIPAAPDIVEARDGVSLTEDQYKKARDFSVK